VAACATGIHSIIVAYHMILDGRADVVIAGASDASITPFVLSAYNRMGVYAKGRLKPYDKSRDGFVVGEGAGVMILEKLSSAQKRNAPIYAKITGVNLSADAFHPVHFNSKADTLAHSIRAACQQADLDPQKLDYVNTHGTGTQEGDLYELAQLEKVFGTHNNGVAMSSIKAMTGHMLGASGTVELMACCLAMKHNFVPPTIYLDMPDPACHLDMTAHTAREKKINRALSFSMGFGGHVGTVALEKI
jgi:3-oxoacyl-[acyl-carrier-protein] synthase II